MAFLNAIFETGYNLSRAYLGLQRQQITEPIGKPSYTYDARMRYRSVFLRLS